MGLIGSLLSGAAKGLRESVNRDVAEQKKIEDEQRVEERQMAAEGRAMANQKALAKFGVDLQMETEQRKEKAAREQFSVDLEVASKWKKERTQELLAKKASDMPAPEGYQENLQAAYTGSFTPETARPIEYKEPTISLSEELAINREAAERTGNSKFIEYQAGVEKRALEIEAHVFGKEQDIKRTAILESGKKEAAIARERAYEETKHRWTVEDKRYEATNRQANNAIAKAEKANTNAEKRLALDEIKTALGVLKERDKSISDEIEKLGMSEDKSAAGRIASLQEDQAEGRKQMSDIAKLLIPAAGETQPGIGGKGGHEQFYEVVDEQGRPIPKNRGRRLPLPPQKEGERKESSPAPQATRQHRIDEIKKKLAVDDRIKESIGGFAGRAIKEKALPLGMAERKDLERELLQLERNAD